MSIVSSTEILSFFGVVAEFFEINSANDTVYFKYDDGTATACSISDGTYSSSELATALKTSIDTAFAVSSTVTYSLSTKKFTISVSAGHTIQYINSGSDMGLTIGFSEDSSAALSITSDQECETSDPTSMITTTRDRAEAWIKKYCRREFETTSYSLDRYDGNGTNYLYLRQYPVTSLDRIAIGVRDVLRVKNTNSATTASISVTSTGIRLVKDGTADTTVTFADNTTLNTIATAISNVSGWTAEVISSSIYGSYKSSELLPIWGLNTIDSNWVNLSIAEDAEDSYYDLDPNNGTIYRSARFPVGFQNIRVDYTAGYTSGNCPDDLKLAVCIITKSLWNKWKREEWNIDKYKNGDLEFTMNPKNIPKEAQMILTHYRKRLV